MSRDATSPAPAAPWSIRLITLSIALLFGLSTMTLTALGVAYETVGGAAWQKLHPATYVAAAALLCSLIEHARARSFAALFARAPGAGLFAAMWALLLAYAALVQQSPLTPLIDTFLPPLTILLVFDDMDARARGFLRLFLHVFMFVNATIGIGEFLTHLRLTPYVVAGLAVLDDYRATALMGHPLVNACATGAYILCLVLGGDRRLAPTVRGALIATQIVAMVAFGGRTSIVVTSLILLLLVAKTGAQVLLGRKFDLRVALALVVVAPVLAGAVVAVVSAGGLDELIARFVDDKGSAQARVVMFSLLEAFPLNDLLFGPDPAVFATKLRALGIEIGVENTWLALMFQYGAVMEAFFIVGLVGLCREMWRRAQPGAWLLFAYFLAIVSSAIGLSTKTSELAQFAALLLFLFCETKSAVVADRPQRARTSTAVFA